MKRIGFTLIELLVVIAITGMLVGILIPALRAARGQARAITCSSNLRQLFLSLAMYEQENGTFPHGFDDSTIAVFPPSGGYVGNAVYDKMGLWWFHFFDDVPEQNLGKWAVLRCPAKSIKGLSLKSNILCGNYGVNRSVCKDTPGITGVIGSEFVGTPLGLQQIRRPAQTLLITDSGYSLISWRGATNAPVQPFENIRREGDFYVPGMEINKERIFKKTISPNCEQDAIKGRHPNRTVNVAFADGHISRTKADDLFVQETDGNYNNRSPLWMPK